MFRINLFPQRPLPSEVIAPLKLIKQGKSLIINGTPFDFSQLTEGASIPVEAVNCDAIREQKEITRKDGVIELTLLFPIDATAPYEARFPEPILVEQDGEVILPPTFTKEKEEVTINEQ